MHKFIIGLLILLIIFNIPIMQRILVVFICIITDLEFFLMFPDLKDDWEYIKKGNRRNNDLFTNSNQPNNY
jgi:hypothetical protein